MVKVDTDTTTAISKTPSERCEKCGTEFFSPLTMMKCPSCDHTPDPSLFGRTECNCGYCKVDNDEVIDATKEDIDFVLIDDNQIQHLSTLPQTCPLCLIRLTFRPLPGLNQEPWYCKSCKTEWSAEDLIKASAFNELEGGDYDNS